MSKRSKYVTIDPRAFISPPFVKCPKCGKNEFGVLSIHGNNFVRRCRSCRHDESFGLPEITKKIIYLDQFAISNMMKALGPEIKKGNRARMDSFWKTLFEKLHTLVKLQAIVCPDSNIHEEESVVSPFHDKLKTMYDILASGISFHNIKKIRGDQLYDHAKWWITGSQGTFVPNVDPGSITSGHINSWQDRLLVTAVIPHNDAWINELRDVRAQVEKAIAKCFSAWQAEHGGKFDDWYNKELVACGETILNAFRLKQAKLTAIALGVGQLDPLDLIPSSSDFLFHAIRTMFEREGIEEHKLIQTVARYLISPHFSAVPYCNIFSLLWASIARKAANGQKKPPNQGMVNDIDVISTLLPYCDAMFIDNECFNHLNESSTKDRINYTTKLFCQNNREEFLNYLESVKENIPDIQMGLVRAVYGNEWEKPFVELYKDRK